MTTLGNPFNTMKSFCPYSQCSHLNILPIFPEGGCSEGFDAFKLFVKLINFIIEDNFFRVKICETNILFNKFDFTVQ